MFVPAAPSAPTLRKPKRWSGDAWIVLRHGEAPPMVLGGSAGKYGDSQAGAVLRYRLSDFSGHRPTAYARASRALSGAEETELAGGLSARPVPGVPLAAYAELRVTRQSGATRLRPAALVVTELPLVPLPLDMRAEVYAQAGYVGGTFATAFVDAQARSDRAVASIGPGELRAGAGAWIGAQKGVSRVDVGPGVTLALPLGPAASMRIVADWRFRVGGDAAPGSGPALTLSAGF